MRCTSRVDTGPRAGRVCGYLVSNIIYAEGRAPGLVCGYHARAYLPRIIYPLAYSLETIRRIQRDNLRY